MRKLTLIFTTLTLTAGLWAQTEDINAVKFVQGQTTDWYLLASNPEVTFTNGNPVINGKTYDLANGNVTTEFGTTPAEQWYSLRTGVNGNWGTICMEKNITAIDGATFWNVVAETETEFTLEQVTEPQAGWGYLIRFTANELKVQYGDQEVATPVTASASHPIQGTFTAIEFEEDGTCAVTGNYIVYNNQLCKAGNWVTVGDHRAYVSAQQAPSTAPAIARGPRMTMPKPNNAPTDNPSIQHSFNSSVKVIKDGQFRIIRDNKMYNAQGVVIIKN